MTRIVAGAAKGRRLAVPAKGTRPTSERARAALFNRLDTVLDLDGARVLDLYAGSGAVGLEALSRGAALVRFVESDRRAADVLAANVVAVLGRVDAVRAPIERIPVTVALAGPPPEQPYDLVFADPPYALADVDLNRVLSQLCAPGWVTGDTSIVVERAARDPEPTWPVPLESLAAKRYGEGVFWYVRTR